jgi:serine/threonine protein kinase
LSQYRAINTSTGRLSCFGIPIPIPFVSTTTSRRMGISSNPGQRLDFLRQIADAIRYAHRKRVIHRALGPQSILVSDPLSLAPRLQVYNWQVGVRESTSTSGRVTNVEDLVEEQSLVYMSLANY